MTNNDTAIIESIAGDARESRIMHRIARELRANEITESSPEEMKRQIEFCFESMRECDRDAYAR